MSPLRDYIPNEQGAIWNAVIIFEVPSVKTRLRSRVEPG